jgi:hypothetical protein
MNLTNLYSDLKLAKPYAVCPQCHGKLPDNCTMCSGRGVVSKHRYHTADAALIKVREASVKKGTK